MDVFPSPQGLPASWDRPPGVLTSAHKVEAGLWMRVRFSRYAYTGYGCDSCFAPQMWYNRLGRQRLVARHQVGNKGGVSGLFRTQRATNHAGAAQTVA